MCLSHGALLISAWISSNDVWIWASKMKWATINSHSKLCLHEIKQWTTVTLSFTCVLLRSHFSRGLEGENGAESRLSASWVFKQSHLMSCQWNHAYVRAGICTLKLLEWHASSCQHVCRQTGWSVCEESGLTWTLSAHQHSEENTYIKWKVYNLKWNQLLCLGITNHNSDGKLLWREQHWHRLGAKGWFRVGYLKKMTARFLKEPQIWFLVQSPSGSGHRDAPCLYTVKTRSLNDAELGLRRGTLYSSILTNCFLRCFYSMTAS